MRKTIPIIVLLLFAVNLNARKNVDPKKLRTNIDQFQITALPMVAASEDSITLISYFDIPNSSLQFVKTDSGFSASYEAILSIRDENENQIDRFVWTGSVEVDDYRATISEKLFTTLKANLMVPAMDLVMFGELFDKDTRERGSKEKPLKLTDYTESHFLFPVVLLKTQTGNWGIGEDLMPVFNNKIPLQDENYHLLISGRCNPGDFIISVLGTNNSDSVTWNETINEKSETSQFTRVIDLPDEALTGLNLRVNVNLAQDGKEDVESIKLVIASAGISSAVNNLEEAIDQLMYIAEGDERKEFDGAAKSELEATFLKFWNKRDPSPGTAKNELMDEYYNRVRYANSHFSTFIPGWRSDMGMIYIIFGAPDDVERIYTSSTRYSGQKWFYYSVNKAFVFIDDSGFGDFRLVTPYYSGSRW